MAGRRSQGIASTANLIRAVLSDGVPRSSDEIARTVDRSRNTVNVHLAVLPVEKVGRKYRLTTSPAWR